MDKPKVSVIVPAYNEAENLEHLLSEFAEFAPSADFGFEVILVDDGSKDETRELAESLSERHDFLKVLHHRANFGITRALETGFAAARGKVLVFFPADLQFVAAEIPRLVEPILADDADLVTGRKKGRYSKRFVSGIYNFLSRKLFGVKVKDMNSCKAFRKEIIEDMALRKDWHRYLVVLAAREGWRIREVDVTLRPRRYGKSSFGFWRIPIGVLDLLSVSFIMRYSRKPMLLFGTLGGVSLALGIIAGLVAIGLRIAGIGFRPLLYLVILLIVVGLLLLMAGFLAEQVAELRAEIEHLKRRRR